VPATHNVRIIRGLPAVADQPVALTIGNFDGVHRGHQAMLTRLIEAAEDLCLPPAVLTFDPHPREFFAPDGAPARLSTLRGKLELFSAYGVARTYIARFDAALAALTPDAFVDDVLVRRLATRWVLVGDDFRFGRARGRRPGDAAPARAPIQRGGDGYRRRRRRARIVDGGPRGARARRARARCRAARAPVCDQRARRARHQARPHARLSDRQPHVAA
jgi:hypothetical protein